MTSWFHRMLRRLFRRWHAWHFRRLQPLLADVFRSRADLMQVFDGVSDPIVVIDRGYRIRRLNQAALSAVNGASFQAVIGQPCFSVIHGRKDHCPGCTAGDTFAKGEKTERMGLIEAGPKPLEATYQIVSYPLRDTDGNITAVAEYYHDRSALVQLTQELYESERARVMEPLAAGLTHQIRQPLTTIRSSAQLVLDTYNARISDADFRESLEAIIENVDVANDVLTDFSAFAKPSQYQMEKTQVAGLLQKGLRLIQQRLKQQRIVVARKWPDDLPEVMLDERLFLQAYLNILVNSCESMRAGGRMTVTGYCRRDTSPAVLSIIVEDSGAGIPRELVSKVFQPFFSTKTTGLGLGLPVAEGIIRSHGGRIHFESMVGEGTRAIIELPLAG